MLLGAPGIATSSYLRYLLLDVSWVHELQDGEISTSSVVNLNSMI